MNHEQYAIDHGSKQDTVCKGSGRRRVDHYVGKVSSASTLIKSRSCSEPSNSAGLGGIRPEVITLSPLSSCMLHQRQHFRFRHLAREDIAQAVAVVEIEDGVNPGAPHVGIDDYDFGAGLRQGGRDVHHGGGLPFPRLTGGNQQSLRRTAGRRQQNGGPQLPI